MIVYRIFRLYSNLEKFFNVKLKRKKIVFVIFKLWEEEKALDVALSPIWNIAWFYILALMVTMILL